MPKLILASALALAAQTPVVQTQAAPTVAPLTLPQQTSLRCAAAFAVVATRQQRGDAAVRAWPAMNPRGKEFFVRAGAQLMDETGITRAQLSALFSAEATALQDEQKLAEVMPGCLLLLEASGI